MTIAILTKAKDVHELRCPRCRVVVFTSESEKICILNADKAADHQCQ